MLACHHIGGKHMTDKPFEGWRLSRRAFLEAAATAGVAMAAVPLHLNAADAPVALHKYQPEFLNVDEWAFVMAATARLIPSEGEGPGARETRVPVFIDRQLAGKYGAATDWYMQGPYDPSASPDRGYQTPLTPAQLYRQGIKAVNVWCEKRHGKTFADLDAPIQDETLTSLQNGRLVLVPELSWFFSVLLANTREGYFADPKYGGNHGMQAWVYIGFPGARASFKEWAMQYNKPYPLGPVSIAGKRA